MLGNHKTVALEFSGGKDSLACLYLLRPYWDRIIVLWMNTGDAFPETVAQMQGIKALVPHFVEVCGNQPAQIEECGPPTDLLPMWDTPLGRSLRPDRTRKAQAPMHCCSENLWMPMNKAVRDLGATLVIRGQRDSEKIRSPIRSGHIADGIEYLFPIQDWTAEEVRAYLVIQGVDLPKHYDYVDSSLDCQHCTAYLFENAGKFKYMREHHPALFEEVKTTIKGFEASIREDVQHMVAAMGA